MNELKDGLDNKFYRECSDFIKRVREFRHAKILDREQNKFYRLCQQNKMTTQTTDVAAQRVRKITHKMAVH